MRGLSEKQAAIVSRLRGGSGRWEGDYVGGGRRPQSYERDRNYADAAPAVSSALSLGTGIDNPNFDAQFNIKFLVKYFTESSGTYTGRTAAYVLANAATLATAGALAGFVFGTSDSQSGFLQLRQNFNLAVWAYSDIFIYGRDYARSNYSAIDATVKAQLLQGDLVEPFYSTQAGPVNYTAFVIIRMTNMAYGTLLQQMMNATFTAVTLRYTLGDSTLVTQYDNQIGIFDLSLFGNQKKGNVDPSGFKIPAQNQNGIVDIPIQQAVGKSIAWATYINYDNVSFTWGIFVLGFKNNR